MPEAASFDSILEQCRDLVVERVSDALTKMLDQADEALTAFGSQSRDPDTSKLDEVTRNKVLSQREAIVTQFRMRFLREFQERGNRVKKIGDRLAEVDLSSLEQVPVGEDDLNEPQKFDAMASKLRVYCDEELLALDQRVGVLIGDADLQSEDNPFTPQAIVDAYKHTCRQIDSNVNLQMVLVKLFDDYVLDEIRGVYKAVNKLLIENSILPKIRHLAAGGQDGAKMEVGESRPVQQTPGNVSAAPVAGDMPQELTNTNLGGGMNQMDTMTLDIMAFLFEDLFEGRKIPAVVKGLIGRLQTPMLKLVIADKSFFSKRSHPARRLLEELGVFSAQLPADFGESDPVYQKLESILENVTEEFEDDVKIFDDARQQLDTLIAEMNECGEQETQPAEQEAQPAEQEAQPAEQEAQPAEQEAQPAGQEVQPDENQVDLKQKIALAKTVSTAEIKARLHPGVPQLIVRFLAQLWGTVLVMIHVREGEESEAWKGALETVDVLLWSGRPKETVEERQNMARVMPGLLKRITAGLTFAGINDEVRVQFFSDLRKLHAELIGESAQPSAETAATVAEPDEAEAGDMAEQPDVIPMKGKPAKSGTSEEVQLEFAHPEGETAAIPEPANTATAKTATPTEKSPATDFLDATMELEAVPEQPAAQDAGPDDAARIAESPPMTLEFEAGLMKPGEQDVAPTDAAPGADSPPMTLEFEAVPKQPADKDAGPADAAAGAQSVPPVLELAVTPEQRADLPAAQRAAQEAAARMRSVESGPGIAASTTQTCKEPSSQLLAEMEKAMEATRTLFSDVDRFLILGQVQNAISLLDHRIKREPNDRESWVKLMAVYRDEDMGDDFDRAYAAFREQFAEKPDS